VLERMARSKKVVLDKTGTITSGELRVSDWDWSMSSARRDDIMAVVLGLESASNHPVARALTRELRAQGVRGAQVEVTEQVGHGVRGQWQGSVWEVARLRHGSQAQAGASGVGVYRDGKLEAAIFLTDSVREDSATAIQRLRKLGMRAEVLSGDSPGAVARTAGIVGIAVQDAKAEYSPEQKLAYIESQTVPTIMVGDGANDAGALAAAEVGIAVHGGMEASMKAADAYLTRPGLMPILTAVQGAKETMAVIYRNYAFSLAYNLIGATAAVTGHMSPLFAAILMPISSITILSSSVRGAKSFR
jgi:P-type E1-E2 ATPase